MRAIQKTALAATLALAVAVAPEGVTGADTPAYRTFVPVVSAQLSSLSSALRALGDGLVGIGFGMSQSECSKLVADALMLPSLDGTDMDRPVRGFLLAHVPLDALPIPAIIVPVRAGGSKDVIDSLRRHYGTVDGGTIKICSNPLDEDRASTLYVAIAEGNAMISPDIDAIRWLAYSLQSKSLPEIPDFRPCRELSV